MRKRWCLSLNHHTSIDSTKRPTKAEKKVNKMMTQLHGMTEPDSGSAAFSVQTKAVKQKDKESPFAIWSCREPAALVVKIGSK